MNMIKCEEFLNSYPSLLDEWRNRQFMEDAKAEEEKRLKELEDTMLEGPLPVQASAFSELTFYPLTIKAIIKKAACFK